MDDEHIISHEHENMDGDDPAAASWREQQRAGMLDELRTADQAILVTVEDETLTASLMVGGTLPHVMRLHMATAEVISESFAEIIWQRFLSAAREERCSECGGVIEHVLGCPEMDRPR